jgi:2-aminoadipate transaminase
VTPEGAFGPAMASWTAALRRSAMEDMLDASALPDIIPLALGLPAPEMFPAAALGESIASRLRTDARALQYGPPASELRSFVAALMRRRGVACRPEQVFLTAGAQQGMSLLARLLIDPGDTAMMEEHGYTGFQQALAAAGARMATVPSRLDTGIDLDALERAFARGPRPKLLYAMADGHNPLGISMPLGARRRLAALARACRVPIIEDDAYGMLSYDDEPLPALRSFDEDWVFYLGSFSKTLAPALRTGWIVAPEAFMSPLGSLKESSDINTATLGQRVVASFVASGRFDDHLAGLRAEYARRRDAMLIAVARAFPAGTRWTQPRAGFFTWVELPGAVDTGRLFHAALEQEKVAFLPGPAFAAEGATPARSALRLSFSYCRPDAIADGVGRIGRTLEAARAAGAVETRDA